MRQSAPWTLFWVALQNEFALVDLPQGDAERLLFNGRGNERSDVVVDTALAEVGVVIVDLTRTLGSKNNELVLRVNLRQQFVNGRLDDSIAVGHVLLLESSGLDRGVS